MRGGLTGALGRNYLHSVITEALWCSVTEIESLFSAKLSHAVMLASMYGNPSADLDDGNDKIHEMYVAALNTMPYIRVATSERRSGADELIEEWKRLNNAAGTPEKSNV